MYQLTEKQRDVAEFILRKRRVGLFGSMNFGKTLVTLDVIRKLHKVYGGKYLIVTYKIIAESVWSDECRIHGLNLRVSNIVGNTKQKRLKALEQDADIYTVNFQNIHLAIQKYKFTGLVIDESTLTKNRRSNIFTKLKNYIIKTPLELVLLLTGTPMPNSAENVWSQVFLLDKGERLGKNISAFRRQFLVPNPLWNYGSRFAKMYISNEHTNNLIKEKIKDICIFVENTNMKELIYKNHTIKLDKEIKDCINLLLKEGTFKFRDHLMAIGESKFIKMLQICSGFIYNNEDCIDLHTKKIEKLKEIVFDDNVVVAYNYKREKDLLLKHFDFAEDINDSEDSKERWNRQEIRMLIMQSSSSCRGINLQYGGHRIIWYSVPYDLEIYSQLNCRLNRTGQKNQCYIEHLITDTKIESNIVKILMNKGAKQSDLMRLLRY